MAERDPKTYFLQAGAPQGFIPREGNNCNRWEAPEINCTVALQAIAGHRTDAHYSISRVVDFRDCRDEPRVRAPNFPENVAQPNHEWPNCGLSECTGPLGLFRQDRNGWRNQSGLRDWYIKNVHCTLCEGDCFVLVGIPPKVDIHHAYIYNECPVEGLTYEVHLRCPDDAVLVLAEVDASKAGCWKVAIPEGVDFTAEQNRIFEVCITAFPPHNTDTCERPKRFGVLSEACFAVAVAGVCPITGK